MKKYISFFESHTKYLRYFKEFVVAGISELKNYINMNPQQKGKDLLYNTPYIIDQYLDWIVDKAKNLDDQDMIDLVDDNEWDQVVDKLFSDKNYEDIIPDITENAYTHMRSFDIPAEEQPSWAYFDNPEIIKNQWLIHFTNENPKDIQKYGFEDLVDDIAHLGLTTFFSKTSANRSKEGYGFSYLLSDYIKYGKGSRSKSEWKYGKNAVLFRASGVRVWHLTDDEYQTIFKGNTARDIIPIYYNEDTGTYQIENKKNKKEFQVIYENEELEKVVSWIVKNFNQYRSVI